MSTYIDEHSRLMTRAMFGEHAVRVPLNFITQSPEKDKFAAVAQSITGPAHPLMFGQCDDSANHLIMGDCVFRPHLIVSSRHLLGNGISGTWMSGWDMREWARLGKTVFDIRAGGWIK
jgi:hypothetical protein